MDTHRTARSVASAGLRLIALAGLVALCMLGLTSSAGSAPSAERVPAGYKLVFSDEFDGRALDTSRWETVMPWGDVTRGELQRYRPEALSVAGGRLVITADHSDRDIRAYSSGTISSRRSWSSAYGYIEMRARVPAGRGLWPALWLVPDQPRSEDEIDVLEVLGDRPGRAYMVLHYGPPGDEREDQAHFDGPDLSRDFHTYAVDWRPDAIVWYIDGIERHRAVQGVPSVRMHLIANLAVGGPDTWPGAPDDTTPLPARYEIDYIRAYQAVSSASTSGSRAAEASNGEASPVGHQ